VYHHNAHFWGFGNRIQNTQDGIVEAIMPIEIIYRDILTTIMVLEARGLASWPMKK